VELDGRPVAWCPLVHPGGRGPVRDAHAAWEAIRTPELRAARAACPGCGARGVVPILYGLPSDDAFRDSGPGRIAVGGCVIGGDDPDASCIECGTRVWPDGRTTPDLEPWDPDGRIDG
jgi:hypothetical protein